MSPAITHIRFMMKRVRASIEMPVLGNPSSAGDTALAVVPAVSVGGLCLRALRDLRNLRDPKP